MNDKTSKPVFGIIRYHNTPTKVQLPNGTVVHKTDRIFVREFGGFIPCAPYSDNFIFEVPKDMINVPSHVCTCGSPAVISGVSGYVMDASPQGKMFLCLTHSTTGKHFNSKQKWV